MSIFDSDHLYRFFAELGIVYERLDHQAVFTADEAAEHVPPGRGAHAKNLLVEDRKNGKVYMLTVPFEKRVDLNATAKVLGAPKLRFVTPELMQEVIGVTPGAVSMLALVNDREKRVHLVVDRAVWEAEAVQCHPLVNTATLIVDHADLARFFEETGHHPQVLEVPERVGE